jgi:hypothetical protein
MGSPQYGRLVLDGHVISGSRHIEVKSLLWSAGGGRLAAQELVSWLDAPVTRVVVFDTEQRMRLAVSRRRRGISNPVRFERGALVYRHWDERTGDREMRLQMENE